MPTSCAVTAPCWPRSTAAARPPGRPFSCTSRCSPSGGGCPIATPGCRSRCCPATGTGSPPPTCSASSIRRCGRSPRNTRTRSSTPLEVPPILPPGEPEHEQVEDGERDQSRGRVQRGPVDLVRDEQNQEHDQPGVRPQLVPQQRRDQDDLDHAVGQQIDGGERDGRA